MIILFCCNNAHQLPRQQFDKWNNTNTRQSVVRAVRVSHGHVLTPIEDIRQLYETQIHTDSNSDSNEHKLNSGKSKCRNMFC